MKSFNIWLLTFLLQSIVIVIAGYFGLFSLLFLHDVTYLGFTGLSIWALLSASIGYKTFKDEQPTELQYFLSDALMGLGLAATMIGLIVVFSSFFTLNLTDMDSVKAMIKVVATGMVSALGPSLCGLIGSYFSKAQLIIVSKSES